jgi:hypothetical protein
MADSHIPMGFSPIQKEYVPRHMLRNRWKIGVFNAFIGNLATLQDVSKR